MLRQPKQTETLEGAFPDREVSKRGDLIEKGFERSPHPSLLRPTGIFRDGDDNKPVIAIVNSYVDIILGHAHLNEVGRVREAACPRDRRVLPCVAAADGY